MGTAREDFRVLSVFPLRAASPTILTAREDVGVLSAFFLCVQRRLHFSTRQKHLQKRSEKNAITKFTAKAYCQSDEYRCFSQAPCAKKIAVVEVNFASEDALGPPDGGGVDFH